MTRIRGSVPDSRTRILPLSPRVSAAFFTAVCTSGSFCAAALSFTRRLISTNHSRIDDGAILNGQSGGRIAHQTANTGEIFCCLNGRIFQMAVFKRDTIAAVGIGDECTQTGIVLLTDYLTIRQSQIIDLNNRTTEVNISKQRRIQPADGVTVEVDRNGTVDSDGLAMQARVISLW